jgi:8-oxo-dGTP pyrophosphatase MutT (NUDIX family)
MPTFKEWMENTRLRVGVVILFHENKILTLHRGSSAPWEPNKWDLPGGTAESDEDIKITATRECFEETKIPPENVQQFHAINAGSFDLAFFTAESPTDKVQISWEHQNFKWVGEDELGTIDFVPYIEKPIKMAFAFAQRKAHAV